MTKFRKLPTLAIIAIALGAILLVSGSAFAAYQLLWPKPSVRVSTPIKSVSGRDEVAISFTQCGDTTLASHYELKSNATITADQVPKVIEARCELDTIGTWASATFPHDDRLADFNTKEHDSTSLNTSMATHIKERDAHSITFVGLTKYNQSDVTFTTDANTRFIANGRDVAANQIDADNPVVYITSEVYHFAAEPAECLTTGHCSISGQHVSTTLDAVVQLSMPFEYYDQFAWQSLAERTMCVGNPNDTCLSGFVSGIDLYEGNANTTVGQNEMKEIAGVITQMNGSSVTIKSSSSSLFTVITSTDIVGSYNKNRAAQYNNQKVAVGSTLHISYVEPADQHSKILQFTTLMSVRFQTEIIGKSDAPMAY